VKLKSLLENHRFFVEESPRYAPGESLFANIRAYIRFMWFARHDDVPTRTPEPPQ